MLDLLVESYVPNRKPLSGAIWLPLSDIRLGLPDTRCNNSSPSRPGRPRSAFIARGMCTSRLGMQSGPRAPALTLLRTTQLACALPCRRALRRVRLPCLNCRTLSSNMRATRRINRTRPLIRGSGLGALTTISSSSLDRSAAPTTLAFLCRRRSQAVHCRSRWLELLSCLLQVFCVFGHCVFGCARHMH